MRNDAPRRYPITPAPLKANARQLRKTSTFPERLVWSRLRGGKLGGLKFRRQYPIGDFIVDFYCHEHLLAIELDGESHTGHAEYDQRRQELIEQLGVRVVRYDNDDILRDLDAVLEQILRECHIAVK
jgi:very-short-patch-repair endonuclease